MQNPEQLEEFRFRLSRHHRAGDVRAVADTVAEAERTTEIAHDDLAPADDARARLVVRAGGVGATPDDGEIDALMAFIAEPGRDISGDLGLGSPDEGDLAAQQRHRHGVRSRPRGA